MVFLDIVHSGKSETYLVILAQMTLVLLQSGMGSYHSLKSKLQIPGIEFQSFSASSNILVVFITEPHQTDSFCREKGFIAKTLIPKETQSQKVLSAGMSPPPLG